MRPYTWPIGLTLVLIGGAIPILRLASEERLADYLSAYATAAAAIIAVMLAVWLEWKKDQAVRQERVVVGRVRASRLLDSVIKLDIKLKQARSEIDKPQDAEQIGTALIQWAPAPIDENFAFFESCGDYFHLLPTGAAEHASILLGQMVVYRQRVEALKEEARAPEWHLKQTDGSRRLLRFRLDKMILHAIELNKALQSEADKHTFAKL